jgi:hypothetical protein
MHLCECESKWQFRLPPGLHSPSRHEPPAIHARSNGRTYPVHGCATPSAAVDSDQALSAPGFGVGASTARASVIDRPRTNRVPHRGCHIAETDTCTAASRQIREIGIRRDSNSISANSIDTAFGSEETTPRPRRSPDFEPIRRNTPNDCSAARAWESPSARRPNSERRPLEMWSRRHGLESKGRVNRRRSGPGLTRSVVRRISRGRALSRRRRGRYPMSVQHWSRRTLHATLF